MLRRKKVMLVDPSSDFRLKLKEAIWTNETLVDVIEADSAARARALLNAKDPDVVFLDIALPEDQGLALIASIKETNADIRVVVVTHHDSADCEQLARERGADYFLTKPYAIDLRLIDVIHEVIRR